MRGGETPTAAARACGVDRKTAVRYRLLSQQMGPSLLALRCPGCGTLPAGGGPCLVCAAQEHAEVGREAARRLAAIRRKSTKRRRAAVG